MRTEKPAAASNKTSMRAVKPRLSDLAIKAIRALARAQREVARENARYCLPLIVVEKGRVVAIPTEQLHNRKVR